MKTFSSEVIEHLARLIRGIKVAMLTTVCEDGSLRSRPMSAQTGDFDGTVCFLTRADTAKVDEVQQEEQVNVSYVDADDQRFISISGRASLVRDRQKIKELWNSISTAWFQDGPDDPRLALLRVEADRVEYWDDQTGAMVQIVGPDRSTEKLLFVSSFRETHHGQTVAFKSS